MTTDSASPPFTMFMTSALVSAFCCAKETLTTHIRNRNTNPNIAMHFRFKVFSPFALVDLYPHVHSKERTALLNADGWSFLADCNLEVMLVNTAVVLLCYLVQNQFHRTTPGANPHSSFVVTSRTEHRPKGLRI